MAMLLALAWFQVAAAAPERVTVTLPEGGRLSYAPVVATDADYPFRARRADAEGTSVLDLTIEPDGRVSACRIAATAGHPDLDRKACDLYRERAQFRIEDRTQPTTARAPVRWVLEGP